MPKWHFLVVLDFNEYQFLGIIMIMHVYNVLIIGCAFYTFCPVSACSSIGHTSHMHTRCTFVAHTLTLDMFCIHSYQLSLFRPFSSYNMFLCLCHVLVYTLFHHPQHVMFTLFFVAFFRCFCLLFELHFLIHLAPLMYYLLPLFISSFLSRGEYSEEYTGVFRHFYMTHVHILRGRNSTLCTFLGGESHKGVHILREKRHLL